MKIDNTICNARLSSTSNEENITKKRTDASLRYLNIKRSNLLVLTTLIASVTHVNAASDSTYGMQKTVLDDLLKNTGDPDQRWLLQRMLGFLKNDHERFIFDKGDYTFTPCQKVLETAGIGTWWIAKDNSTNTCALTLTGFHRGKNHRIASSDMKDGRVGEWNIVDKKEITKPIEASELQADEENIDPNRPAKPEVPEVLIVTKPILFSDFQEKQRTAFLKNMEKQSETFKFTKEMANALLERLQGDDAGFAKARDKVTYTKNSSLKDCKIDLERGSIVWTLPYLKGFPGLRKGGKFIKLSYNENGYGSFRMTYINKGVEVPIAAAHVGALPNAQEYGVELALRLVQPKNHTWEICDDVRELDA